MQQPTTKAQATPKPLPTSHHSKNPGGWMRVSLPLRRAGRHLPTLDFYDRVQDAHNR